MCFKVKIPHTIGLGLGSFRLSNFRGTTKSEFLQCSHLQKSKIYWITSRKLDIKINGCEAICLFDRLFAYHATPAWSWPTTMGPCLGTQYTLKLNQRCHFTASPSLSFAYVVLVTRRPHSDSDHVGRVANQLIGRTYTSGDIYAIQMLSP